MNEFYNTSLQFLLEACLAFILALLPIWIGKTPIQKSSYKIIATTIVILFIGALWSYTQPMNPLPYGLDNDTISIKASWNNDGFTRYLQGCYTGAIMCYDEAIKIDPKYVIAWSNKGNALKALNRTSEAKEALMEARRNI